jgi:hypothetical protein
MSTVLAFATRRVVLLGTVLWSSSLTTTACGGRAIEDENGTGAAFSTGGSVGGGHAETGGVPGAGGAGGLDNGCNLETVECPEGNPNCECPGVFDDCPFGSVHCDADAEGQPRNCTCGEPALTVMDCDYYLQYRCNTPKPGGHVWTSTCTCDPVLPTDDEPCRYYQQMTDDAGLGLTCTMVIFDTEPEEKYKYYCSCMPAD